MKTKSEEIAADIVALLRARTPLIWITTREEARVEKYLVEAAIAVKYLPRTWDAAQGCCNIAGKPEQRIGSRDPNEMLNAIGERCDQAAERGVWVLRDFSAFLFDPIILRQLRNLARTLPSTTRAGYRYPDAVCRHSR